MSIDPAATTSATPRSPSIPTAALDLVLRRNRGDLRFAQLDADSGSRDRSTRAARSASTPRSPTTRRHPIISYFRKTSGDLRVARFDGTQWTIEAVDLIDNVGRSTDIAVDKKTGEIAVAYEDSTHGWLKIARLPDGGRDWTTSVVDDLTRHHLHVARVRRARQPGDQLLRHRARRPAVRALRRHDLAGTKLASNGAGACTRSSTSRDDGLANIIYYNRRNNLVAQITGDIGATWTPSCSNPTAAATSRPRRSADGSVAYSWFQPASRSCAWRRRRRLIHPFTGSATGSSLPARPEQKCSAAIGVVAVRIIRAVMRAGAIRWQRERGCRDEVTHREHILKFQPRATCSRPERRGGRSSCPSRTDSRTRVISRVSTSRSPLRSMPTLRHITLRKLLFTSATSSSVARRRRDVALERDRNLPASSFRSLVRGIGRRARAPNRQRPSRQRVAWPVGSRRVSPLHPASADRSTSPAS
jgi:hypothetical protein